MKTLALIFLALTGMAHAASLNISSSADDGPGSLRQALIDASNGDTITFEVGTVTLSTGELIISKYLTITGPVEVTRDAGAPRFRIFSITPGRTVTLERLTIRGGYADASFGAGILNDKNSTVTIKNCVISDNFSDAGGGGGGICNFGFLKIVNSTISDNRAGYTKGFALGYGGGIQSSGVLEIIGSTISGNLADLEGAGIDCNGVVSIINSTISGNVAGVNTLAGSGNGGGINNGGVLTISNSTVAGNLALNLGDGITNNASLLIGSSILSESAIWNGGTITSLGYNIASDNGAGMLNSAGDQINVDAMLGALSDNGGPTFTHGLLNGSPAIDAGNPGRVGVSQDQRGYARVYGDQVDVGSFEEQPPPSATPTPTATQSPIATPTMTPTASPSISPTQPPTPTPTITPNPTATPLPTPQPRYSSLLNISTRGFVQAGDGAMIAGFILAGSGRIVVRGIGPSLAVNGRLIDPVLELRDAQGTLLVINDNWQDDPITASNLTFNHLAPTHSSEAGIWALLSAGSFTARLSGRDGGTGIGLVEVYDLGQP